MQLVEWFGFCAQAHACIMVPYKIMPGVR